MKHLEKDIIDLRKKLKMIQFEDLDLKYKQLLYFKKQAKRDALYSLDQCSSIAEHLLEIRNKLDKVKNEK